jgi:hypothetical protein
LVGSPGRSELLWDVFHVTDPLLMATVSEVSTLALSCTVAALDFCETAATDTRSTMEPMSINDLRRNMETPFSRLTS